MIIPLNKIWLFQSEITDPFIFNDRDDIAIVMSSDDDRVIENITVASANWLIDTYGKGGLVATKKYGGEDSLPISAGGKISYEYSLSFNFDLADDGLVDQLIGGEYSFIGQKIDKSYICSFPRMIASDLPVDNDVIRRVEVESEEGGAILFKANNINIQSVINGLQANTFDFTFDETFE